MRTIDFSDHQLFDGAMGTRLFELGFPFRPKMEEMNISHPQVIRQIHREYADAGADFITTATFGVNRFKYYDSVYSVKQIVTAAIDNAKMAAPEKFIALDIGPIGRLLEPYGEMSEAECYDAFKDIIDVGRDSVDAILFETFMDIEEIKIGIRCAKENSSLPVIATMTFDRHGKTMMGVSVEEMVETFEMSGVDALGINCSWGPKELIPLVERCCQLSKTPIIVQPNAGIPDTHEDGSLHYTVDTNEFTDVMKTYLSFGVKIIGGCCGTNSETIRQCSALLR